MPSAKDAERTVTALAPGGIPSVACTDLECLCKEMGLGAGAALLTEEAILHDHNQCLKKALQTEPPWSGFPLIVLVREGGVRTPLPEDIALHATLVERPLRMVTLKSVVDTALRHRRKQYQLRGVLEDLERANQELELRVSQRTAKLREVITELEAFSYSVSHDLRAPLRAMRGYAEALLEDEKESLSANGKEYLKRIERAANRLDLLVQDVLAYTKVAKGEIHLQALPVEPLIGDILRSYPELSEKAAITVERPLPPVIAHEGYLSQCVANLLGNAVKFVPPDVRPTVRVWAEVSGDQVRINFKDNGIGIAPEHIDQIFQLFGRIHPTDAFPGTGIGLAIVKRACERMGGAVGVESELNRGSCFWINLRKA
jgi:signal transduction histidine kinase